MSDMGQEEGWMEMEMVKDHRQMVLLWQERKAETQRGFFSDSPGCRAASKLASHDPSPFYPRLLIGTLQKLTPRSIPPPKSPLLTILLWM